MVKIRGILEKGGLRKFKLGRNIPVTFLWHSGHLPWPSGDLSVERTLSWTRLLFHVFVYIKTLECIEDLRLSAAELCMVCVLCMLSVLCYVMLCHVMFCVLCMFCLLRMLSALRYVRYVGYVWYV